MKALLLIVSMAYTVSLFGQESIFRERETFPGYILRPVVNYPGGEVDIHKINNKFIILNFWGTWCAPCMPEMDSLARLQNKYASNLQVIGISNDSPERLKKYLALKPTKVLLASDTAQHLYRSIGFSYVGQSIILNADKKIIAMVKTDSINNNFIQRLLTGKKIRSSAELITGITGDNPMKKDQFGVDSTTESNVCLRSYMPGLSTMSFTYPPGSKQGGRRRTYFNTCVTALFKDAFDIVSEGQVIYEADEKKVCNFDYKSNLICFDFMVRPDQKDSFKLLMQKTLNNILPYKGRIEYRKIPVIVLKRSTTELLIPRSDAVDSSYGFSGKGFTGKAVHMATYINYLSNDFRIPVVDETGLTGRYDIKTENAFRTKEEIIKAIEKIGFSIEESERLMPVLIIY